MPSSPISSIFMTVNKRYGSCFDTVGWVTWPVKISSPNDLYCVEWDVKPYSTTLWFVVYCRTVSSAELSRWRRQQSCLTTTPWPIQTHYRHIQVQYKPSTVQVAEVTATFAPRGFYYMYNSLCPLPRCGSTVNDIYIPIQECKQRFRQRSLIWLQLAYYFPSGARSLDRSSESNYCTASQSSL